MALATAQELGSAPLWLAAHHLLKGLEREFRSHSKKAERALGMDEVHDLRVASRRLREGLALFSPLFRPAPLSRLAKRVKKVTRRLGPLRNLDEARLFFSQLPPGESDGVEIHRLVRELEAEGEKARSVVGRALRASARRKFRKRLHTLLGDLNLFRAAPAAPLAPFVPFAHAALIERAEPVRHLLPEALQQENADAQHRLRIAVKKLRYRLEITAPLFPSGYEELHGVLKTHQDLLGKLHDVDVFAELVRERIAEWPGRVELLHLMAQRRRELFTDFATAAAAEALPRLTDRLFATLSPQPSPPDRPATRPSPGRPRRQRGSSGSPRYPRAGGSEDS